MALVQSLRTRVLLWVSVALTALFAISVAVIDAAFRQSTDIARQELLEVQLLGLIGLADEDFEGNLVLPSEMIDRQFPQFQVADSGLYGVLWDQNERVLWQSLSTLSREFPLKALPATGEQTYVIVQPEGFPPLEALLYRLEWEFEDGRVVPYTFGIAVSLEPYRERQAAFRRNLIGWFTGITAVMLGVLTGLLRWVLRPLRTLEHQVREVEAGERVLLTGDYPAELTPLAGNLNALIETERRRLVRYRNTLDDLAHSLKTPLAAMRSLLHDASGPAEHSEAMQRELERMDQRVSYQLRRARASGATGIGVEPVAVEPIVADLKQTLDKVYRAKRVSSEVHVSQRAMFQGDPGDLMEVLGNLLDNAYKYCRGRVALAAEMRRDRLVVTVDDDGLGIGADQAERLLERGVRADESVPGQGIGLAVVRETVELYHGTLEVGSSPLGGARITIALGRAGAEA